MSAEYLSTFESIYRTRAHTFEFLRAASAAMAQIELLANAENAARVAVDVARLTSRSDRVVAALEVYRARESEVIAALAALG